jgi:hypothetical protein
MPAVRSSGQKTGKRKTTTCFIDPCRAQPNHGGSTHPTYPNQRDQYQSISTTPLHRPQPRRSLSLNSISKKKTLLTARGRRRRWVQMRRGKRGVVAGDLHKNNLKVKENHRLTLQRNYFTNLTLLCGAPPTGATHAHVAPFLPAPLSQPTWLPRR